MGSANYNLTYLYKMCLPIEKSMIIVKIQIVNSELIIAINLPIISFIP